MNPLNSLAIFGFALPQRSTPKSTQPAESTPIEKRHSMESILNGHCLALGIPVRLSGDLPAHTYIEQMGLILAFLLERERNRL